MTFALIGASLLICLAPDMTWINTDCDGAHYVYSAENLYPAHKTSAPLYLLLGNLFINLPGDMTDFWKMGLISVIAGVIASVFIYLTVKRLILAAVSSERRRAFGLIAAVLYSLSALVISQETIVESYSLLTMTVVGAYYFSVSKKWILAAVFMGAGFAIHWLSFLAIAPIIFFNRELWRPRYLGVIAAFALFYLYIPLTNRAPYMWTQNPALGNEAGFFVQDIAATIGMLVGGMAIWDVPKRLIETIMLLGVSLNVGLIGVGRYFWKSKPLNDPLFWMIILPVVLFFGNLAIQTYVYLMPTIAFGSIAAAVGFSQIQAKTFRKASPVVVLAIFLIGLYNTVYFDIGENLDPNLEAARFYNEELSKVPDGAILMPIQGWEWAMIFKYNADQGRNIIPVYRGSLPGDKYVEQIAFEYGINVDLGDFTGDADFNQAAEYRSQSIIALNPVVYTTRATDPRNYGAEVIPAVLGVQYIQATGIDLENPSWRFDVDNPYDIITGAVEVERWVNVMYSNITVFLVAVIGSVGIMVAWFLEQLAKGRRFSRGEFKRKIRVFKG